MPVYMEVRKRWRNSIAKGVSEEGVNVKMLDVNDTDPQFIRDAIEKADGIIVGSPTIAGDSKACLGRTYPSFYS